MKDLKIVAIVVCALLLNAVTAQAVHKTGSEPTGVEKREQPLLPGFNIFGDSLLGTAGLDKAIEEGDLAGEAGVYFEGTDPDDPDPSVGEGQDEDYFFGTAYIEMAFESASMNGLQFGIGAIAVNELWWDREEWNGSNFVDTAAFGDDYTDNYDDDAALNMAYLKFTFPNTKSSVLVGRKEFEESIVMDGDFHQGIEIAIKDLEMVDIYLSAVEEWADDSGADEIGGETLMEDGNSDADDWGYSLLVDFGGDNFSLKPFVHQHSDVVLSYGVEGNAEFDINENMSLSIDGAWSEHSEDTPDSVSATDDDWNQYLLGGAAQVGGFSFGGGFYARSDDADSAAVGTGIFQDDFSPMEEIEDWADTTIYFVEVGYDFGAIKTNIVYGIADDDKDGAGETDSDADEIDLELEAQITDRVAFEIVYADVNFDETDENNDYGYWEGGVSVSF
ncbi:MAG: hypothetical protein KGZ25_04185 [Planctomycetes bacterium]|nr:hypothetical protein [Planctomycetota bacterium]